MLLPSPCHILGKGTRIPQVPIAVAIAFFGCYAAGKPSNAIATCWTCIPSLFYDKTSSATTSNIKNRHHSAALVCPGILNRKKKKAMMLPSTLLLALLPQTLLASSIIRKAATYGLPASLSIAQENHEQQQPLTDSVPQRHSIPPPLMLKGGQRSHPFEPAENSVGLLLTYEGEEGGVEVVHFWMGLGQRVFARTCHHLLVGVSCSYFSLC